MPASSSRSPLKPSPTSSPNTSAPDTFTVSVPSGKSRPARADTIPELKSLFELRKNARAVPPPICPTHPERLAHYKCGDTGRPLCEECGDEKKFGGTSVRVCGHCGGTATELHEQPGDID